MECELDILSQKMKKVFELIDTLWNVNTNLDDVAKSLGFGINRYIMECKFKHLLNLIIINLELIDTLWNVNQIIYCHLLMIFFRN